MPVTRGLLQNVLTSLSTIVIEPLTADVTIAGPVGLRLYVSTSGTDSDFVVKLIDVYPAIISPISPDACQERTDVLL